MAEPKIQGYVGSVELQSGIKPMGDNDYPLAEAHSILVDITETENEDGSTTKKEVRLDEELATIKSKLGSAAFETDETLSFENGVLKVNTADVAEADNTKPIKSSAVHTIVGNIEALLKTI